MINYVPERGDVVWLDFDPQIALKMGGAEIQKRRPALVISPRDYNRKAGLALVCPITSKVKHYPFEVAIAMEGKACAVLSDHVKSQDFRARNAKYIMSASKDILAEVLGKLEALLEG